MREIYYNSDITPKAINEIKLLSLYYDKIHIVNDSVYAPQWDKESEEFFAEDLQFIPKSFYSEYKLLIDTNIIRVTSRKDYDDSFTWLLATEISKIVNSQKDFIFPIHPEHSDTRIITEEVFYVMKSLFDFDIGKPIEVNFMWWYYAFKLKWFLKLLMEGKNCISSSTNLIPRELPTCEGGDESRIPYRAKING